MATSEHTAVRRLERRLHRLEWRRRALTIACGLAIWLCILLPTAGALCLLDWYSHMPLVVRWLASAGLVLLAVLAARRFVRPAVQSRHVIDQTALTVERRFPALADRVISAVQLDRRRGDAGHGSEELIDATQAQAVGWAGRIRFARALPLWRLLPPVVLGGVVTIAATTLAVCFPRIVGIWAARCFWQMDYPHKTRIVTCPRQMLVARGDPAVIAVKAAGLLPARGSVRVKSGTSGWVRQDLLAQGRRGEYVARVQQVVEPLPFRVELGDATPVEGLIEVADRPDIADIAAKLNYPDYTHLPAELSRSGHIRAVPGTRVALTVQATKPLVSARLQFEDGQPPTAMTLGPSLGEGKSATATFDVARDGFYSVHLTDSQNFSNVSPVRYRITAVADSPPRVVLARPGAETLATPVSIVRMDYRIGDDYGLRSGRLMFRLNEEKEFKYIPLPLPGLASTQPDAMLAPPGPRRAEQTFLWDLSPLGLRVGDVVSYRLAAEDHAPRPRELAGLSPDREIRIVDAETIARRLREDLEAAAVEIERVYSLEQESRERVRQLLDEIRRAIGATTRPER